MSIQDIVLAIRGGASGGSTGTIVLGAVIIIALSFVVGAVVYVFYRNSPRGRVDALLDVRAQSRSTSRWPMRLAMVGLLIAGFFAAGYAVDRPSTCFQCHQEASYAQTLQESAHADVSCLGCHGGTGVAGGIQTAATYGRWVYTYASTQKPPEPSGDSVSDAACLQCHAGVSSGVSTNNGIRVRHSDFLEQGAHCRDCHNDTAHGDKVIEPTSPSMDDCVSCHDQETASAECETCHVKDELLVASETAKLPKLTHANTGDCYGCHEEKPCLECHGITMPHPKGWGPKDGGPGLSGSHALEGFTDRELCWRCHYSGDQPFERPATRGGFTQTADGCTCHGSFGDMHGGEAWVAEHGLQATGRKSGPEAECFACHDARYLCDQCHDETMKEKYDPKVGPESYIRDIPKPEGYWEY